MGQAGQICGDCAGISATAPSNADACQRWGADSPVNFLEIDIETTKLLANFLVDARWADVPDRIRHEARRAILNWAGCAIGGCQDEAVVKLLEAVRPFAGPPTSTVVGRGERLDALNAALVNGVSSNILDFDDTHLATVIHPTVPVASALLAAAECRKTSGERFLLGFVLGVEAECRIGNAVAPGHFQRGWQSTATCGVFGAAAAAGNLLGLTRQQMIWALGMAATQSAGLLAMGGSMSRSYSIGSAARNGLAGALLAQRDFTSSECGLEGRNGFLQLFGNQADGSAIGIGLGETWELAANAYKPFPCGVVLHAAIDACLQLRNEHAINPQDIRRITATVHPLVLAVAGNPSPRNGLEAKLSIHHSVAVALLFGAAGMPQYSDATAQMPEVVGLRARVDVIGSAQAGTEAASVSLELADGRTLARMVTHAIGTPGRPLSDAELEAKFKSLAGDVLPASRVQQAIDLVWSLDQLADVSTLAEALSPTVSSRT